MLFISIVVGLILGGLLANVADKIEERANR